MDNYLQRYVLDGGLMMFALVPTSILAAGYVIQGFITLRKGRMIGAEPTRRAALDLARRDDREGLSKLLSEQKATVFSRILRRGLVRDGRAAGPHEEVNLVRDEIARLFRGVHPLAVIYSVAPLMGILGTVMGLMQTFSEYAVSGAPTIAQLSRGMDTALITTIWGLCIAIPSYIFHQVFRARLIRYEEDVLPEALDPVFSYLRDADLRRVASPAGAERPTPEPTRLGGRRDPGGLGPDDMTEGGVTPRTRPPLPEVNRLGPAGYDVERTSEEGMLS